MRTTGRSGIFSFAFSVHFMSVTTIEHGRSRASIIQQLAAQNNQDCMLIMCHKQIQHPEDIITSNIPCSFFDPSEENRGFRDNNLRTKSYSIFLDFCEDYTLTTNFLEESYHFGHDFVTKGLFHDVNQIYLFLDDLRDLKQYENYTKLIRHESLSLVVEKGINPSLYKLSNLDSMKFELKSVLKSNEIIDKPHIGSNKFQGYTMKVAIMPWTTNTIAVENPNPVNLGNVSLTYMNYSGFEVELLKAIQNSLKVNYEFLNPTDGEWGNTLNNGTWNGMVDLALRGEVDFMMGDNMMTYSRFLVLDYSVGFGSDYMTFCTPLPGPQATWKRLLAPFRPVVWVCFVASIFVAGIVLHFLHKALYWMTALDVFKMSLTDSFWFAYGSFMGENQVQQEPAWTLRLFLGFWVIYGFVMTSSYGGNLIAFMTTPAYTDPITDLQGVIDSELPWAMVLYGEEEEKFMAVSEDPVIQRIWRDKLVIDFSPTPDLGKVRARERVLVDYRSGMELGIYLHHSTPSGIPLVYLSPDPVFKSNLVGFGFHKFNPFRKQFDAIIDRAIEAGLLHKWNEKALHELKIISGSSVSKAEELFSGFRPLAMKDLVGISMFYAVLISICFVCLMGEIGQFLATNFKSKKVVQERRRKRPYAG